MSNDNFEKPSGQGGRNWILLAAVFLALVVVGGGVALLVMKDPHMRQVVMGTWDSGKPADVDSPERFSKQGIAFEYPGNWQVLEKKSNAEVPVWIELKSTGPSSMQLAVLKNTGLRPDQLVANSLKGMRDTRVFDSPGDGNVFEQWGGFKGFGRKIQGKLLMTSNATVRLFSFTLPTSGHAVLIVEMRMDRDKEDASPGYDLVEKSFSPGP